MLSNTLRALGTGQAALRPFPPSLHLQAKNPGPEKPPEPCPQLSPSVSQYLCWQIPHAFSLRHNLNAKPNPNTNSSPGCVFRHPSSIAWSPKRPDGGPLSCTP